MGSHDIEMVGDGIDAISVRLIGIIDAIIHLAVLRPLHSDCPSCSHLFQFQLEVTLLLHYFLDKSKDFRMPDDC